MLFIYFSKMKIRRTNSFLLLATVLLLAKLTYADDEGVSIQAEEEIASDSAAAKDLLYKSPFADPIKFYFADHFDDFERFATKWITSQAKKDDTADEIAKYDGEWNVEMPKRPLLPNDLGLVLKSKAKHAAIASRLNRPFVFSDKPLVVQYEVNLQDGQECGGSYIKLLSSGKETTDLQQFRDKTPYTIMFGPDKCGNDMKLHFIFRHVNPINGTITEKHCRKAKDRLDDPFKDKQPHLYQLVVRPDNTYVIRVDHKIINEGSMFTDFTPAVNPPKEIDDPSDFKPENWDERERIPDPDAMKPEDWNENEPPQISDPSAFKPEGWLDDEEEMIPDPNAVKPFDWDVDMDGEWEAPLIANPICEKAVGCGLWKAPMMSNPNYKGKWRAPLIDNPNYQGKWAPRKISNPDFFEDKHPFKMTTIAAIGIELWSMSSDILFDNLIIVDDETVARDWAAQTYDLKRKLIDREANTFWDRAMKYMGYRPGYWFAYFIYCSIPVIAYIWFLLKRRDKESTPSPTTRAKKTDECVPDDNEAKDDSIKSKSNLNSNEDDKVQSETANAEEVENDYYDDDCEEDEEEADETESIPESKDVAEELKVKNSPTTKELDGVKKRKPRKE